MGKIAASIAVLSVSLLVLSSIDSDKVTGSLAAMGTMFAELIASMAVLETVDSFSEQPSDSTGDLSDKGSNARQDLNKFIPGNSPVNLTRRDWREFGLPWSRWGNGFR